MTTMDRSRAEVHFYSWLIMLRIARPFVPLAVRLGLSANAITLASIMSGFLALIFLVRGTIIDDLIGLFILQFSFLLDCIDGDVARIRLEQPDSPPANLSGAFLDYSRELLIPPLVPVSLAAGLFQTTGSWSVLYIAAIGSMLKFAPQISKEHVIISELRRAGGGYIDRLKTTPVLSDSLESVKKGRSPFALSLRLAKSLFGFPGGLINSMTVIAFAGYFLGENVYIFGKTGLIWIASLLYLSNFLFTYLKEFRQMKQVPPAV